MATSPNPLPADGVLGRLTDKQADALKQFWKELFQLIDNAPLHPPGNSLGGNTNQRPSQPSDVAGAEAGAERNVPKDDNAKERQRANEEMHNARLAFAHYGSERFVQTFWRFVAMDHPDSLCLKFLRARKWNPTAGVAMFAACMKWRIESGVEEIFEKGEEGLQHGEGFLHQMTSGKAYLHGSDRLGRPVFYVHARMHKSSEQSPKALEDFVLFQMESLRCLAHGLVEKVTMVFDLTGFGLSNMDWRCLWFIVKYVTPLSSDLHISSFLGLKPYLRCLESYYPESLNVILINNPPWVFNGIWKIVSPALDPQVRAKVQLTKTPEELYVHIAPEHLAPDLGGRNSWAWQYPQIVPGENSVMKGSKERQSLQAERDLLAQDFQNVTRSWLENSSDDSLAARRSELAKRLRAQYFDLDPYIRGRGAYHRLGNIVGNGLVSFHYPGAHDIASGEVEVMGMEWSKETLEAELGIRAGFRDDQAEAGNHAEVLDSEHRTLYSTMEPQRADTQVDTQVDRQTTPVAHTAAPSSALPNAAPVQTIPDNDLHGVSRQTSRDSMASGSRASVSASLPTQKSRSSGKLRARLSTTGSKIKQFGSMRSLAGKAH